MLKKEDIQSMITHLRPEFKPKDLLQIIVGSAILAIPVGFTEESWRLGAELPLQNIIFIMVLSLIFISAFVYYTYYRHHPLSKHWGEFLKRAISTYLFAFLVVSLLLTIIQKAPWTTDALLAFKRVVLVSFPSSMSAVVADTIK